MQQDSDEAGTILILDRQSVTTEPRYCELDQYRKSNMSRTNYFLNYGPLASSETIARLAVNPDGSCDIHDPRNTHYLRPLSIAADEKMANDMAEAIYGAVAEKHAKDRTFNSDEVYQQCLVNTRRMLRDREYWSLYGAEEDFLPPLQ
jgi:hypothetical protein